MQPSGRIRLRANQPKEPDGYCYPIYLHDKAPLHDVYDSAGTIIHSSVGKITVSYREVSNWAPSSFERQGFSGLDLVTNMPVCGPSDLRKFEVASIDHPREEIVFEIGAPAKFPSMAKEAMPAHRLIAADLGLEPEWFELVDAAWRVTYTSKDQNPEENDEFYEKLDDILDYRDRLEMEAEESDLEDEDNVIIHGVAEATPDAQQTESVASLTVNETVSDLSEAATEAPKGPDKYDVIVLKDHPGEGPITTPEGAGHQEVQTPGEFDPGETRRKKGNGDFLLPDRDRQVRGTPKREPMEEDRNPLRRERRKSFEVASARLSAIARTKNGRESRDSVSRLK